MQGETVSNFRYRSEHNVASGSVSEPTADVAVGEFAEGGNNRWRSADRKLFV